LGKTKGTAIVQLKLYGTGEK